MGGQGANQNKGATTNTTTTATSAVSWQFTGSAWESSGGVPPTCPTPLLAKSPVNVSKATEILYPGQTRGGNYKAHGGFIFRGLKNTDVTVVAPMDGQVVTASRYIEAGETQYLLTMINPCGMMYRFDHVLTLSPAMQKIADTLPAAQVNNSETTRINPPVSVKAGDVIASAIGFVKTKNVSVDFGLYDLRTKNEASSDASYAASHSIEQAHYAICWLPLLPGTDAMTASSLPGGDQSAGKKSDYCK